MAHKEATPRARVRVCLMQKLFGRLYTGIGIYEPDFFRTAEYRHRPITALLRVFSLGDKIILKQIE